MTKKYRVLDTGEVWTEAEIRSEYESLYGLHEQFSTFESYLDYLIGLGRQKIGGVEEIE